MIRNKTIRNISFNTIILVPYFYFVLMERDKEKIFSQILELISSSEKSLGWNWAALRPSQYWRRSPVSSPQCPTPGPVPPGFAARCCLTEPPGWTTQSGRLRCWRNSTLLSYLAQNQRYWRYVLTRLTFPLLPSWQLVVGARCSQLVLSESKITHSLRNE